VTGAEGKFCHSQESLLKLDRLGKSSLVTNYSMLPDTIE
jgi:hypothetical protein